MKKTSKRILTFVITLLVLFTALPVAAIAAEFEPLNVDDVVALLKNENGVFDFTASNTNLDTPQKLWEFYRRVEAGGGDNFMSIANALYDEYGDDTYGDKPLDVTVEGGFNRVYHAGSFIAGHLTIYGWTNDTYEDRWESYVGKLSAPTDNEALDAAFDIVRTKYSYDSQVSDGQKSLLAPVLGTSIEDGYNQAIAVIQEKQKTKDGAVAEKFRDFFLTDMQTGKLIDSTTIMNGDNPWFVICGSELYDNVLNDNVKTHIKEWFNVDYPALLRLAQAHRIVQMSNELGQITDAESILAILTSKEVGNEMLKKLNNIFIYGDPGGYLDNAISISADDDITPGTEEKEALDGEMPEGYAWVSYLSIGITINDGKSSIPISEPNGFVSVMVGSADRNKEYKAFRYHNGVVEAVDVVVKDGKIFVKSNKFSSFMLVSKDKPSGGCYVATAVYDSYDCPEVWTLRRFRDETLAQTWYGRAFIHTYYAISPTLVKWFGDTDWFKNLWRGPLDKMVANLNAKGVANTPYDDMDW